MITTTASARAGHGQSKYALVDVDDTVVEVHGHAKQGAGFGYNRVRGLNALLATLTTTAMAPVIVAQRLRKGAANSSRGAKRLVGDAVKTARRLLAPDTPVLVRMDSAFFGRGPVHAALKGGAAVSVTVRMNPQVKAAITAIGEDAWTSIEYTDAVFDEATGSWISRAEVAEIDFTAFAAQKRAEQVPGRLVVRRILTSTPTSTAPLARTPCSTPGGSTRSSPPPTRPSSTPWPRTRRTGSTRSSSSYTPI